MATSGAPPSRGENIGHFTGIRLRVLGEGNLNARFHSLDDIEENVMVPLPMVVATGRIPTRLGNFTNQRCFLELNVTELDEYFKINRIVILCKELYSSYPG